MVLAYSLRKLVMRVRVRLIQSVALPFELPEQIKESGWFEYESAITVDDLPLYFFKQRLHIIGEGGRSFS